ncbi:DUF3307 domain-containing protein [Streptococcus lutetiensis]|uniref:DUF3307 domain-containing protein n=1 Tax=Streptococcus lutetiensis TaxID=150055 RepID=UPI001C1151CF|nr:DUF3307 domain-containing protein [Streptococcus lutetiensis]MBU5320198.1 DUF3307 domain-containing protein [Streptococcus lutetiensis]
MLIDYAKFFLAPKFTNGRWPAYLFTVDQFCHYLAIIGIFLILGQYATIALVFTAKSIARYDMISKNQGFAEYYLIGSLFSMISVLVTYALLIF